MCFFKKFLMFCRFVLLFGNSVICFMGIFIVVKDLNFIMYLLMLKEYFNYIFFFILLIVRYFLKIWLFFFKKSCGVLDIELYVLVRLKFFNIVLEKVCFVFFIFI